MDRSPMWIDPDSPSVRGILRGEKGRVWQWFSWAGCIILANANIIAAIEILHL